MRQRIFARGKRTDKIQIQQCAKLLNGKIVDRLVRRMVAGVVDEAVDAPKRFNRASDERLDLFRFRDIARHIKSRNKPRRVQLIFKRRTFPRPRRAKNNAGTFLRKQAHASRPNSRRAARNNATIRSG
jgi:hypothetical protein